MWLLAGQKAPDHSTIARFRTGFLAHACEDLFYQMIRKLASMKELSMETVFIDGTKLEACANKYTFQRFLLHAAPTNRTNGVVEQLGTSGIPIPCWTKPTLIKYV